MSPPPLTADEEIACTALQKLVKGYEPRMGGGFDPDDVSMHCYLPASEIKDHLDRLVTQGLVIALDAPMEDDAWPTHYTLPLPNEAPGTKNQ